LLFCYCSLHPCGIPCVQLPGGTKRICKSCQHSKPNEVAQSFWTHFFGDMKDTKKLPALRFLLDNGVLPLQDDAHSCGIGLIAAIGIMLRVIIGTDNDGGTGYNEMFRRDHMEINFSTDTEVDEDICCFPSGAFPILFEEDEFGSSLYLHVLKAEWFRLFDCIAELQPVTVPQRQNVDHLVDHHYEPMRTDNEFVSQFKEGFLDEVKRIRCGFVYIFVLSSPFPFTFRGMDGFHISMKLQMES
jgi:hypothetical protein